MGLYNQSGRLNGKRLSNQFQKEQGSPRRRFKAHLPPGSWRKAGLVVSARRAVDHVRAQARTMQF